MGIEGARWQKLKIEKLGSRRGIRRAMEPPTIVATPKTLVYPRKHRFAIVKEFLFFPFLFSFSFFFLFSFCCLAALSRFCGRDWTVGSMSLGLPLVSTLCGSL